MEEIEADKSLIEKDAVSVSLMVDCQIYYAEFKAIDFGNLETKCTIDVFVAFQKGRMEKTLETVRTSFNSVRTGRANPAMLDKIEV